MAGRRQHFIPQALLRGFSANGRTISVFEAGRTYNASIRDVAAERDFYTRNNNGEFALLDDIITNYEYNIIPKLNVLRVRVPGEIEYTEDVGRLISHLAIRNPSVRTFMSDAMKILSDELPRKISDINWVVKEMNFNTSSPNQRSLKRIRDQIKGLKEYQILSPKQRREIEIKAYHLCRERIGSEFRTNLQVLGGGLGAVAGFMSIDVGVHHQKLLLSRLDVEKHQDDLRKLKWHVLSAEGANFIFPDCSVVAVDVDGSPNNYLLCERKIGVLLPISSRKLLIGWRGSPSGAGEINKYLASASEQKFFAERIGDRGFEDLTANIGSAKARANLYMKKLVQSL
jgi:hypothetical protein